MLDRGKGKTYACCSSNQLSSLDTSLTLSKTVLVRCPSCADNFAHLHCINTCSPNQTQSLQVTKVMNVTNKDNITREAVVGYKSYLSTTFADAAFHSCKNVRIPATGGFAIATMCGRYGAKLCTPQHWYDFQGDSSNGLAPLDIDFNLITPGDTEGVPEGIIPYAGTALKCNETTSSGGQACSCQDCQDSCPRIPPLEEPPGPFEILGLDGYLFISIILFIGLSLAFILYIVYSHMRSKKRHTTSKKNENDECGEKKKEIKDKNSNDIHQRKIKQSEVTCAERSSMAAQAFLSSKFQTWGTVMATYPFVVSFTYKFFNIF